MSAQRLPNRSDRARVLAFALFTLVVAFIPSPLLAEHIEPDADMSMTIGFSNGDLTTAAVVESLAALLEARDFDLAEVDRNEGIVSTDWKEEPVGGGASGPSVNCSIRFDAKVVREYGEVAVFPQTKFRSGHVLNWADEWYVEEVGKQLATVLGGKLLSNLTAPTDESVAGGVSGDGDGGTAATPTDGERRTAAPQADNHPDPNAFVSVEKMPEAVDAHPPEYPLELRAVGLEGLVRVRALVRSDGTVGRTIAVTGPPPLRDPAAEAVRRYRFTPAVSGGQPVAVWVVVPLNFRLEYRDSRKWLHE